MLFELDRILFQWLFNISLEYQLIGELMVIITDWSSIIFALIYMTGIGVLIYNKSKKIVPFLLAPITSLIAVQIIRILYYRPRPFIALNIENLIYHSAIGSLPSRHAISAFVIAISILFYINNDLGKCTLFLAAITGLSRVMVGVHYPLDIIVGALLAFLISLIFKKISLYLNLV